VLEFVACANEGPLIGRRINHVAYSATTAPKNASSLSRPIGGHWVTCGTQHLSTDSRTHERCTDHSVLRQCRPGRRSRRSGSIPRYRLHSVLWPCQCAFVRDAASQARGCRPRSRLRHRQRRPRLADAGRSRGPCGRSRQQPTHGVAGSRAGNQRRLAGRVPGGGRPTSRVR